MAALLDLDWLFYVAGGMLGVAALWLLWRGLLADRSRGRARCPKCWYDLSGIAATGLPTTCSECGHTIQHERQVRRTRRHWRAALAGVVVAALGAAALLTPKVRREGVWAVVPTWLLVTIDESVLTGTKRPAGLAAEIQKRLLQSDVPDWAVQRLVLGRHCALRFRSVWPADVPLLGRRSGTSMGWQVGVRDKTASPGMDFRFGAPIDSRNSEVRNSYELGWSDNLLIFTSGSRVTQLLARFQRRNAGSGRWDEREVAIPLPLTYVATIDEAISPVRGPEVDRAVREGLALRLMQMPTSKDWYLAAQDVTRRELEGVTLGLCAEVRDGERIIARTVWWQREGSSSRVGGVPIRLDTAASGDDTTALGRAIADAANPRYSIRIAGLGEMALHDFDGTRYWSGEFTLPLIELIRPAGSSPASDRPAPNPT